MSEQVGEAVVELRGDTARLDRDLATAGKSGGAKFASGFKGAVTGLAATLAVGATAGFLKGAIDGASDLNETVSKTEVVFGGASAAILDFASQGAARLGQTKQEALDAASTFGIMGKAAGLQGKELSGFSTELVDLATDMASFNNASPEETINAIGAALRGEAEPIRRFGVLLDDASLREEALRQGLIKTTKEALTPQQKTLAAQALIMKQTADAQGDFARTSDGLANKQRILSATFEDLKTRIGQAFLPAALAAVDGLLFLVEGAESLGPALSGVADAIAGVFAGGGGAGIGAFLADVGAQLATLAPVIQATFVDVLLPALSAVGGFVISTLVPVFTALAAIFSQQILPVVVALATFFYGTLYPAIVNIATAVGKSLAPVFVAIAQTISGALLPAVSRIIERFREWLPTILAVVKVIVVIIGWVLKLAAAILGKVLPPLIRFAGFLLRNVVSAVLAVITIIIKAIGWLIKIGAALIKAGGFVAGFAGKVRDLATKGISTLVSAVASLPGKLLALGPKMLAAGRSIIGKFVDGMKNAAGIVSGIAGNVWDAVRGLLNGAISRINAALSFTIKLPGPDITINPPDIPHLAHGTGRFAGGYAYVGENGPELVSLPTGSKVTPTSRLPQQERVAEFHVHMPTGDPEAAAAAMAARWVLAGVGG